MKRMWLFLLCCLLLTACTQKLPKPADVLPVTEAATQAPTEAQMERFNLYYGDQNAENFLTKEIQVPEITDSVILEQLIAAGVLPEDTVINLFTAAGSQLNIDFNAAFLRHLNTMGTAGERMLIGSVVNTFLSAYGAQTVFLTIDGEIIESGHVIYDFPLEFMF